MYVHTTHIPQTVTWVVRLKSTIICRRQQYVNIDPGRFGNTTNVSDYKTSFFWKQTNLRLSCFI